MAAARGDRRDRRATTSCARTTSSRRVFNRDVADAVAAAVADQAKRAGRRRRRAATRSATRPATREEFGAAVTRPPARRTRRMRVTVTGATGLIGTRLVAALQRARRRGHDPRRASPASGVRLGPAARPGARRGARRPRRRRPPGRRERRPALERRRAAAHPRVARARHPQPRRRACAPPTPRPARARSAPRAVGYYGPHGDERARRGHPAGRRLPRRGVRRLGARGRSGRGARPARRARPHRRRARHATAARWRRCCCRSSSASAARSPAATSTCRGSTSTTSSASTSRRSTTPRWTGPVNATAPEPGDQPGVLQGARPRAAPPGRRARSPASRSALLYGDMAEIVTEGQRAVPQRALALGYAFQHPELDEALRAAVG